MARRKALEPKKVLEAAHREVDRLEKLIDDHNKAAEPGNVTVEWPPCADYDFLPGDDINPLTASGLVYVGGQVMSINEAEALGYEVVFKDGMYQALDILRRSETDRSDPIARGPILIISFFGSSGEVSRNRLQLMADYMYRISQMTGAVAPEFHHCMRKGSDKVAHQIAWALKWFTVGHPLTDYTANQRASVHVEETTEPDTFTHHMQDMVEQSDLIIAMPAFADTDDRAAFESTWDAINYARRIGKHIERF